MIIHSFHGDWIGVNMHAHTDQPHARTHRRRGQPSSCMMLYKLTEACKEDLELLRPRPSELCSSTSTTRPRRPRPERLRRAPTTSTTRPRPERLRRAPTTSITRPRRPRPERLRQAPTTSTTRPCRNDDRHEERRYDNHDHRHNRPKSTRIRQLYRHRPDFYPKISTLLIFIFNIIFITMFLHNILIMIILQIMFVRVYHLKYNIQLYLM